MTSRDGVLPVDKPEGPTSHDVVAAARRALRERRIGHTGTLDPFASGLLLLCVGRATRLAEYLTALPKRYTGVARLGERTDTDDRTGEVVGASDAWRALDEEAIRAAFEEQRGERLQVPPAYSAKKVGGERLHRRARRGETVSPEPARVVIHDLRVLEIRPPDVRFELECSSGTYVRAIARDAGERLGVGAHLRELRRDRVGDHDVRGAVPLDRLEDDEAVRAAWITPLEAVAHLPRVDADERTARALVHGARPAVPNEAPAGGLVAVASAGELLAIAQVEDGLLRPRKVFGDA